MRLTAKIVLGFVSLIFLLAAVNIYSTSFVLEQLQEERLKTTEVIFAKSLSKRLYRDIIEKKINEITDLLFDEKGLREEKIDYIAVYDRKGYLLAHTFLGDMPRALLRSKYDFSGGEEYRLNEISSTVKPVYEIAVPVMEGIKQVGSIHIGIRSDYINNIITPTRSATGFSLIITLLVGIIAVIVVIPLSRKITSPIRKLKNLVEKISKGELDTRIDITSKDEIGDLARAFNQMTEELKKTTVSKGYVYNIFRSMSDSLIVVKPDGTISTVNKTTLDLLEYTEEELIGRPLQKIFAENPMTGSENIPLITNGYTANRETVYLTKYGKEITVSFASSVMRDSDGRAEGIVCMAQDITRRIQSEEALRANEERFRALFESSSDAIIMMNYMPGQDPYVTDCNSNALEMFSCRREELIGNPPHSFSPQMQEDGVASDDKIVSILQTVAEGNPVFFEWTFSRGNGDQFQAEVSCKRIDVRETSYLQAVVRDISERKWIEEAIKESEEYARSFIDSSQDCVCNLTVDGKFMSMNPAGYILNDLDDSEDIVGIQCTDNVTEKRAALQEAIQKAAEGEKTSVQFKTVSEKGNEVWWDAKLTPLIDLDGSIKSIMKVGRDITAYKNLETSLLDAQELLKKEHNELSALFTQVERGKKEWESTMDCMGDMIILADGDGKIRRCNKAIALFTGSSAEEIIGKDWEDLMSENDLEISTFYAGSIELLHSPTHRWFTFNSYPFKDSTPENSGTVITIHETTETKKITEELEKAYSELKATQSTVLQREKMASIGQLAAGVAHEINNPMGFITSNLGTLGKYMGRLTEFINVQEDAVESLKDAELVDSIKEKRKKLKLDYIIEDVEQLIAESLDGAERVKRIVQNLKTFSRVDESEYKHADINECIESTLNIIWNELKYKATVQKDYQELPPIKCYPQELNQVFLNLLVNAAHAIEKQGEVKIKTFNGDGMVSISISDTGCGIPSDKIDKIFEPFYTTKEVGKGTGLGLSISYDIVKKHNGEIIIDSTVGVGTTFTVRIPVVED